MINRIYYLLKAFIPRSLQILLRREIVRKKRKSCKHIWPIDERSLSKPKDWSGWPGQKKFAVVLLHDVETELGQSKCRHLMKLEEEMGFRSLFSFVPERYDVLPELRRDLVKRGFEVGVHGLKHDGKLFLSKAKFFQQAIRINHYLKEWESVGFVSPSMHRNLAWIHELNIEYDASTFDTDPFEPQPDGMKTIFPFAVHGNDSKGGYVELPYTLPQDFTLFILMKENNIDIWKKKLDWVVENEGMVLLITHPDYMNYKKEKCKIEEYPVEYYKELLEYVKSKYKDQYWNPLPRQIARFWSDTYKKHPSNNGENFNSSYFHPVDECSKMVKPRVLMIVENSYPGDSRVRKEATALEKSFDITVISLKRSYKKWYEIVDGVEVFRLPEVVLTKNRIQNRQIKFLVSILNYALQYFFFTSVSAGIFLLTHVRRRYKVIHAHNPPDTLFLVGLLGKLFSVKFVYDHHDLAPELYLSRYTGRAGMAYKILLIFEKFSCKLADVVIATNNSYKDIEVNRHGIRPDKIYIVRNDPIIRECSIRTGGDSRVSQEKNKKKNVLFLGSINPQDGVEVLIDAFRYLVNDLGEKDVLCRLVGDGDSLDGIKARVKELDLMEFFEFTGYVYDREKIKEYLAQSDVCVEPAPENALNRSSTFIKIMEYMAAKKPIVAFDLIETRYSANETALLVPPGNIKAFAYAIKKLLNDPKLRQEISRKGFQRVTLDLTWEKASRNLAVAYKSLF